MNKMSKLYIKIQKQQPPTTYSQVLFVITLNKCDSYVESIKLRLYTN